MRVFGLRQKALDQAIEGAVTLAAKRWTLFAAQAGLPHTINLRDRVAYFAPGFRAEMERRHPTLHGAADTLLLLIVAQGIEASGLESRRMIELQLGIILPPRRE